MRAGELAEVEYSTTSVVLVVPHCVGILSHGRIARFPAGAAADHLAIHDYTLV